MKTPEQYSNFRLREITEEFVHSERDRSIIIRKFCDRRTMEQLAEEFDLSVSQVKRIITREGETVFRIMGTGQN